MPGTSASPRPVHESLFRLAWQDRTLRLIVLVAFVIRTVLAVASMQRGTAEAQDTHTYLEPTKSLLKIGRASCRERV